MWWDMYLIPGKVFFFFKSIQVEIKNPCLWLLYQISLSSLSKKYNSCNTINCSNGSFYKNYKEYTEI